MTQWSLLIIPPCLPKGYFLTAFYLLRSLISVLGREPTAGGANLFSSILLDTPSLCPSPTSANRFCNETELEKDFPGTYQRLT